MAEANYYFVMSNPVEGREDEYNEWYDSVHLAEVVAQRGIVAAQRFRLNPPSTAADYPQPAHRYMAIYEFVGEADDVLAGMRENVANGSIVMSPALDRDNITMWFWDKIGPRLVDSGGLA